jgi:cbb3-type cytochrome oxidase maturation protein
MITILFMVSVALLLSVSFVICYLWSVSSGQFDDLTTPALRMLKDDAKVKVVHERNHDESKQSN